MRALHLGFALAVSLLPFGGSRAAGEAEIPAPSLGVVLAGVSVPEALAAGDPDHPIDVRIVAEWSSVETAPGVFDWTALEPPMAALAAKGARVTLCLRGESPFHPRDVGPTAVPDGAWLQAWTALLRSAVATLGGRIATVEIGERPDLGFDPIAYAFVLKSSSLAVKAESKAHGFDLDFA